MAAVSWFNYSQCTNLNAGCFLTEERCVYLWGIVTKLPKTRKQLMTNTGLFNSHCCAPMLLLFLWFRGVVCYPGICLCEFLSYWLHTNSFTHSNCPLNSMRALPASGCKSQPLALFRWGGLNCVGFFNITVHSGIHNTFLFKYLSKQILKIIYTVQSIFK